MDLGQKQTIAKLAVEVVNTPELSTWVWFAANLPTCLDRVGCQQVAKQVHLGIHIRLLLLPFDNSILSKLHIQQPIIHFCKICSLRYCLFCNLWISFDILSFCLWRRSMVLLCDRLSARCLDYQIWKTTNCWCSVDAHFQNAAGSMSLLPLPLKAANIWLMDVCNCYGGS